MDVEIDVLDAPTQRALVLPTLLPEELIASVLQEFREMERLGIDPSAYELLDAKSGKPLENHPIGVQYGKVQDKIHLKLVEHSVTAPKGAQPAGESLYLREQASGRVFKLDWLPAIVGRPDRNLPDNQLLAANLEVFPSGLRVSRRHVLVGRNGNDHFVQRLSGNPTSLRRATGEIIHLLDNTHIPIFDGDVIHLERSQITLKFICWRPQPPSSAQSANQQGGEQHGE